VRVFNRSSSNKCMWYIRAEVLTLEGVRKCKEVSFYAKRS
jgi:hypothetical protein